MSLNRTKTILVAWVLVLLAVVPALGAHPVGIDDMQLFAPADMSKYGGGYRANEGPFFSFEGLLWWLGKPDKDVIGDPTTRQVVIWPQDPDLDDDGIIDPGFEPQKVIEFSTLNTGLLNTEETSGQRYEFGFVEGHEGWLCSIFNLQYQTHTIHSTDVHVVFDDAPFGVPPIYHLQGYIDEDLTYVDDLQVKFDQFIARYEAKMWGTELSYIYRMHPFRCGGILEWYLGARYLELNDRFFVDAVEFVEDVDDPANGLGDSNWNTWTENHVVGPQVGIRWFRKTSRWTWSTEGRFFAGFNSQTVKLKGELGSNLDPENAGLLEIQHMPPSAFDHSRNFHEWSPAAELRLDLRYQLTRSISAAVGWTGLWIDGIARSPSMIDYSLGQDNVMGITDENHEDVFTHGLSFRVELNR